MTFVRIYPYTDFAIEMWGFKRRLTDTLLYLQHELLTCFPWLAAITQHVNRSEGKWILRQVYRCFPQISESYDCRTNFNSSLGMEYNGELYGFSAAKVKLVDSFIWRPFILSFVHGRRWHGDLTHLQVFILNNSFSNFPYFYWHFVNNFY